MSYDVSIEYKGDMILVSTSGTAVYADSYELFSRIVDACKKHNCYRILAKSGLKSMSTTTAHDHEKIYKELGITKKYKVAWFVADPEIREKVEYAAAVLRNRNLLNGYVFSDYIEAKEWLLSGDS